MAVPDSVHAQAALKMLTAEPHTAGSSGDRGTAQYLLRRLEEYGLQVEVEEFQVKLSEPVEVKVDLLEPVKFSGPTRESVQGDTASTNTRVSQGFNAFSASGDVTSDVVYANYGLPEDFDFLRSRGVSAEGKIVIVRYGGCYRGVKAMMAEREKAAGLLIYSDPQEDGYHAGLVYPRGPWRPPTAVQRGSVLYDFIYPGVKDDDSTVPHIPVAPLSYQDARHIMENLQGVVAPPSWQGALPFTYHVGPGPAKIRLDVHMQTRLRTIWNVIAKIPGTGKPEEVIVAGNHRDAWVYGAADPNSGTTAMLEMARGFGTLLKEGWHPQRSIWLCSWDAEEPDEFGSTEWTEKHSTELTQKAVAYLNLDIAVAGDHFVASATPSLKRFLQEIAVDVPDPKGGSVLERANQLYRKQLRATLGPGSIPGPAFALTAEKAGNVVTGQLRDESAPLKPTSEQMIEIGNLGGGSDFLSFFYHFGIPATEFGFRGAYGVYHSAFDDYRWMEAFGDPQFAYHVAAARFDGLETLRLAQADLLPLDYEGYAQEIQSFVEGIRQKLTLLGHGNELDFGPAQIAAWKLAQTARILNDEYEAVSVGKTQISDLYRVNRALVNAEKAFLSEGLPARPWYKHTVFAPAFYSGYQAAVLPQECLKTVMMETGAERNASSKY